MRILFFFIANFIFINVFSQNKNNFNDDVKASIELAKRIIPKWSKNIEFEKIKSENGKDVFELSTQKKRLVIGGNSANSMCVGLNYYLKNYCNVSVSWYKEDNIILPKSMPEVVSKFTLEARVQRRFFLNYCTFGYTMPWWKWKDWEYFIDWMALNGINMPLAITGQEAIWYNVWRKYGLTDLEIRTYFTGPAYLPWHRMANIDKWDGPLPKSWLNSQLELQKKIVAQERKFNMTPVLPAFAGHVPEILKLKYPKSKITSLGEWGDFESKYQSNFLDPFDPLFNKIQKDFLTEQTKQFGTNHIYGTDPFNEVTPPSWEPSYLASAANTIFKSMDNVDKKATWLQMTWIFSFMRDKWTEPRMKAFVTAVPQNRMILLDYFCENTEVWKFTNSYYGMPFIWNYLGNFGGNTMLSGNLEEVENRIENTLTNAGKNMWGLGSTLEGFGVNQIMYQYIFDKAWSKTNTNVEDWVNNWANDRAGFKNDSTQKAWNILLKKVYNNVDGLGQATLTNARPTLKDHSSWTTNNEIKYKNKELFNVWKLLANYKINENNSVNNYDITNVGRQVLGNYFTELRDSFANAYNEKNIEKLTKKADEMNELLMDLDSLLSTHSSFLLGKWISDAKAYGINEIEKKYYEKDAKRIITTWGTAGRGLNEYANRSWAGLTKKYYAKRWKLFTDQVIEAVKNNKEFDEKDFLKKVVIFEESWVNDNEKYSNEVNKNVISLNKFLIKKYGRIEN